MNSRLEILGHPEFLEHVHGMCMCFFLYGVRPFHIFSFSKFRLAGKKLVAFPYDFANRDWVQTEIQPTTEKQQQKDPPKLHIMQKIDFPSAQAFGHVPCPSLGVPAQPGAIGVGLALNFTLEGEGRLLNRK